jgi:branched-subunit amino acid aminotransferase/4-amino-4-deoxychorismate lyase
MSEFWSSPGALPSLGHPWLRGDGLFETLKTVDGKPILLDRHLDRLFTSADELLFVGADKNAISEKMREIAASDMAPIGRMRLTYFSNGEFLISHEELLIDPAKIFSLGISPHRRYSRDRIALHKTLSYTSAAHGLRMAASSGLDDLLYLNEHDEVIETGLANILVEKDGVLVTPRSESGLLPGIVRGVLLEWFPEILEAALTLDDLKAANGLYLLSSIRELAPISHLEAGDHRIEYVESEKVKSIRRAYLDRSHSLANS